jgi:hypothetical protein
MLIIIQQTFLLGAEYAEHTAAGISTSAVMTMHIMLQFSSSMAQTQSTSSHVLWLNACHCEEHLLHPPAPHE